jgi:plastocyanin
MRVLAGFGAVLILAFAAACGGGGTAPTGGDNGSGGPGAPATAAPTAAAGGFTCTDGATDGAQVISFSGTHGASPTDLTIKAGDTVTFTNNGSTNHQIEFGTQKCSTFLLVGKSISVTFNTAGTYKWNCLIHPSFETGTITVS